MQNKSINAVRGDAPANPAATKDVSKPPDQTSAGTVTYVDSINFEPAKAETIARSETVLSSLPPVSITHKDLSAFSEEVL